MAAPAQSCWATAGAIAVAATASSCARRKPESPAAETAYCCRCVATASSTSRGPRPLRSAVASAQSCPERPEKSRT
ncbi:hypothetical protein AF335_25640 [Streptomyces eurocidicus]|uniref:Uncharacterized protein n=1 Tax=Streptomyces eurocidicus TaxID=66423 RepID=A0A2N8NRL0_STREU|nr:hypothetical protein AF335_25640 [Streptomyces eurocidicus]